jgi:protein arginine kinase
MPLNHFVEKELSDWMQEQGPDADVVISSRIRLARNIADLPFSSLMTDRATEDILKQLEQVMETDAFKGLGDYELIKLNDMTALDRKILVEKHLISPRLSKDYLQSAVVIKDDESVNIMVNEEDHLRIQSITSGFSLQEAYQSANQIDDAIENIVDFAFDERLGYLTSCLTNVGTGLRASVMVHIPALVMTGQAKRLLSAIQRVGLAVRGYYGEGSEAVGNIYQISNQLTLGYSEQEIIENLEDVIRQVIDHERYARKQLMENTKLNLEDTIYRSLGILLYARIISSQEAMQRISDVRLGIDLGMVKGLSSNILKELMVVTSVGFLQKYAGKELESNGRDIMRAKVIRERLINIQFNEANFENDSNEIKSDKNNADTNI